MRIVDFVPSAIVGSFCLSVFASFEVVWEQRDSTSNLLRLLSHTSQIWTCAPKTDVRLNDDEIVPQTGISRADDYSSINEASGPSNRLGDITSAMN